MGEGQEEPAAMKMARLAETGGWIMLQNVHLMQDWLPKLERQLELLGETAHEEFRCFLSAEPPPFSYQKIMPEALLQNSIKVANEVPADMKSNLRRAWVNFSQEWIDECPNATLLKGCLFTLCFYHALVQGRRRFGQQGFSKYYSFNVGDLTVCGSVLKTWIGRSETVPWQDIRYILAGIMYGGHITDFWDRRCNTTYLDVLLQEQIFKGFMLAPGFRSPDAKLDHAALENYILDKLPRDSPPMFRMHPNAEIGYLSTATTALFRTILVLERGGGGGGDGGGSSESAIIGIIDDLMEQLPENFNEVEIRLRAEEKLEEEEGPFVLVVLQEIRRMNTLTSYMNKTMEELKKGLNGELNMSQAMEELGQALSINQVPGRNIFHLTSWEKFAWPSKRSLNGWFKDLLKRIEQLQTWTAELQRPHSLWLPGLFNPMAFLTALMQVTGRRRNLPLDNMTVETHLSLFRNVDDVDYHPEDGAFVHGLFIEGARWGGYAVEGDEEEDDDTGDGEDDLYEVSGTKCGGHLLESRLKELLPMLPIAYFKAVEVQPDWEAVEVGYLRHSAEYYDCPCYSTTFRGPTYIVLSTLKTVDPVHKWTLAGVAIIFQEDE